MERGPIIAMSSPPKVNPPPHQRLTIVPVSSAVTSKHLPTVTLSPSSASASSVESGQDDTPASANILLLAPSLISRISSHRALPTTPTTETSVAGVPHTKGKNAEKFAGVVIATSPPNLGPTPVPLADESGGGTIYCAPPTMQLGKRESEVGNEGRSASTLGLELDSRLETDKGSGVDVDTRASSPSSSGVPSRPASEPMAKTNGTSANLRETKTPPITTPHKTQERSSFLGVIITQKSPRKPPRSKATSSIASGSPKQTLVSALSHAFKINKSTVANSTIPPTVAKAKRPLPVRRTPHVVLNSRLRPPPVRTADIAATLGTVEAEIREPQVGGRGWYDAEAWKEFWVGEEATRRRQVCLRFIEAKAGGKEEREKGGPRIFAVPRKSKAEEFIERLEGMFGPGSIHRGEGPKPKQGQKRRHEGRRANNTSGFESSASNSRATSVLDGNELILGKRARSVEPEEDENPLKRPKSDKDVNEEVEFEKAVGWLMALQKLIKGKTATDEEGLRQLGVVMDEIYEARDGLKTGGLESARIRESVEQLSQLDEIPFEDEQGLQARALVLIQFWNS